MHGWSLNNIVCLSAAVAKAGRLKRIYVASTLALSGLAFLSIFYTDSPRTLGDFYAGCFLGMSSQERLPGWRQTVFGSLAVTATLTLVRVILPDVGGSLGVAAFFAVALVVGLRRAMAIARKVLDLRNRRTMPINSRPYPRQSITAGSDHARKSRVSYPTEKRTPVQQSLIRTTIAETQLSTAVAVAGKSIRRPIAEAGIECIGRAQATIFGEMQMTVTAVVLLGLLAILTFFMVAGLYLPLWLLLTLLAVSLATAFGPDILPTLWPKSRQQPKRRK